MKAQATLVLFTLRTEWYATVLAAGIEPVQSKNQEANPPTGPTTAKNLISQQQRPGARNHGRTNGCPREQHRCAAELADHGLADKADQSAFDALERGGHEQTTAPSPRQTSPRWPRLSTKTVVDQHSLDIAARITPLNTKVANALPLTAYTLQSAVDTEDAKIATALDAVTALKRLLSDPQHLGATTAQDAGTTRCKLAQDVFTTN